MTDEKYNPISRPSHYQFSKPCYEVRDVIIDRNERAVNSFGTVSIYDYDNAIKYILRAPYKNGVEDLQKAKQCLCNMINGLLNKME